jgi:Flp pilus assembly protein TadG
MKSSRQSGATLALVTLCLLTLCGFAALAVDMGILYTARNSSQNAADAAAMAGAHSLANDIDAADPVQAAGQAAIAAAGVNKVMGQPATIPSGSITAASPCPATPTSSSWVCVDVPNQRVTANVANTAASSNPISTFFARVIGVNSADVATIATAEVEAGPSSVSCLKPLFMPSGYSATGCLPSMFDASGNLRSDLVGKKVVLWIKGGSTCSGCDGTNCVNGQKVQTPNSNDGLLSITDNPGGAGVDAGLAGLSNCTSVDYSCSSILNKPGVTQGPVESGVTTLITANNTKTPDTWVGPGQYCIDGQNCSDPANISDTSPQLVNIAVWDCTQTLSPGRTQIPLAGFAKVFIDSIGSGPSTDCVTQGIQAHLVSASSCGTGGGAGTGTSGTGFNIRLVQRPQ